MNIYEAERSLNTIYTQLSKSDIFQGYRPRDLLFIAFVASCFTFTQPMVPLPGSYMDQWMIIGTGIALIVLFRVIKIYNKLKLEYEKKQFKTVLSQLFPAFLSGFLIYITLKDNQLLSNYLPGIFSIVFGLGMSSMVPYLKRSLLFVVFFYIFGGIVLINLVNTNPFMIYQLFGSIFAIGHFFTALIIKKVLSERNKEL